MFEDIGLLGVLTDQPSIREVANPASFNQTSTFWVYCCFQLPRWLQTVGFGPVVPVLVPMDRGRFSPGQPQGRARAKLGMAPLCPKLMEQGRLWALGVF